MAMKNGFAFGKNWARFLRTVDSERVRYAEASLDDVVGDLRGKTFLDVGCGSGLVSLAAVNLGAKSVLSFDSDPEAVNCTKKLRDGDRLCRSIAATENKLDYQPYKRLTEFWDIAKADILNINKLWKTYDVVYAWGVLHHTGDMKQAMENIIPLVAPNGLLFLSIYNDQGNASRRWLKVKQLYNTGWLGRWTMLVLVFLYLGFRSALGRLVRGESPLPFKALQQKKTNRGMSFLYDLIDWTGGLPFEVAKPEEVIHFYQGHDFRLKHLKTCAGSHGCNQFLFSRNEK